MNQEEAELEQVSDYSEYTYTLVPYCYNGLLMCMSLYSNSVQALAHSLAEHKRLAAAKQTQESLRAEHVAKVSSFPSWQFVPGNQDMEEENEIDNEPEEVSLKEGYHPLTH